MIFSANITLPTAVSLTKPSPSRSPRGGWGLGRGEVRLWLGAFPLNNNTEFQFLQTEEELGRQVWSWRL